MSPAPGPSRTVIHFGMDKTGSSSLRASLSARLKDPRFHYVMLGISNASRGLAAAFKEDPASFPFFKQSGLTPEELAKVRAEALEGLEAELRKAVGRTAVMSAEAVTNFSQAEFANLCGFIGERSGPIQAVGYIRRPRDYMESVFQQQVKGSFVAALRPRSLLGDYRARFEKFDAVLGKDNARLWLFEPRSFPDGCVVQDFCSRIGIQVPKNQVIRVNEGLSRAAVSLLFAYRKFGGGQAPRPTLFRENALLTNHLEKLGGPKLRLHSSLTAPVIRHHRDAIAWMEERLGEPLTEDLRADDAHAIRSESDLLQFPPESLKWLAGQLGPDCAARCRPGMPAQEVAEWVDLLRVKLAAADEQARKGKADTPGAAPLAAGGPTSKAAR